MIARTGAGDRGRIVERVLQEFGFFFFFQAEDGIRDFHVTGVQTCALPILVVAVALDLRLGVSSYRSVAADAHNTAYAALRSQPPGRLLELPVLHPSVGHGSVYLYYDMQARRERPGGYSTVAPKAAATLALRLEPLSCGDWRPGTERVLRHLGVRYLAV